MTHIGKCLTAKGVKPIVTYKHAFLNTYLYGCFSPINGASFVWEIEGVNSEIFEAYLAEFAKQEPDELKIILIDNAGFHSTKSIDIPENIVLINIPAYTPELNPAEKIWQFIKEKFKNIIFKNMEELKQWLWDTVKNQLNKENIKSITNNDFYNDLFYRHFES